MYHTIHRQRKLILNRIDRLQSRIDDTNEAINLKRAELVSLRGSMKDLRRELAQFEQGVKDGIVKPK